jgi:hypothetical protein
VRSAAQARKRLLRGHRVWLAYDYDGADNHYRVPPSIIALDMLGRIQTPAPPMTTLMGLRSLRRLLGGQLSNRCRAIQCGWRRQTCDLFHCFDLEKSLQQAIDLRLQFEFDLELFFQLLKSEQVAELE